MKFAEIKNITIILTLCSFIFCAFYQFASKDLISSLKEPSFDKYAEVGNVVVPLPIWPTYLEPTFGEVLKKSIDFSKLSNDDERKFMEEYLPVMIHRARNVGEYCRNHPEIVKVDSFPYLHWIRREGQPSISWCCNFKVGSGTWTVNFLKETNFNKNNPKILNLPLSRRESARFLHRYGATPEAIPEVFPIPKTDQMKSQVFKNSIRFVVVRHPFTRILSSYRNVIERSIPTLKDEPYFSEVRKLIIQKYRTDASNETNQFPTFKEFISYFIAETEGIQTFSDWKNFLDTRRSKHYWMPFWITCNMCASDFTVISKLETMKYDERFLAILANLTNIRYGEGDQIWRHKIANKTSFELAKKYYKQISHEQMLKIYNLYKYDFKLFSYDIEDYLELLSHS